MTLDKLLKKAHDDYRGFIVRSGDWNTSPPFFERYEPAEINSTFQASPLAAHFTVWLYNNGKSPDDIRQLAKKLSPIHIKLIEHFSYIINVLFVTTDTAMSAMDMVARQANDVIPERLDMYIEMSLTRPKKAKRLCSIVDANGIDDPIAYLYGLSEEQVEFLQGNVESRKWLIRDVPPSHFKKALPLGEILTSDVQREAFYGNNTVGTVDAFDELSTDDKFILFRVSSPIEAGVILRQFGCAKPTAYLQFKEAYKKQRNSSFVMTNGMEDIIQDFLGIYGKLDDNSKSLFLINLSANGPSERIMRIAVEHGFESRKYLLGLELIDRAVAKTETILASDMLCDQYESATSKSAWLNLLYDATPEHMGKISSSDLKLLYTAREYAKTKRDLKNFTAGFKVVAAKGDVGKWAKSVIDYHQSGAVGGDSYRATLNRDAA
jgi:hypothetical protein